MQIFYLLSLSYALVIPSGPGVPAISKSVADEIVEDITIDEVYEEECYETDDTLPQGIPTNVQDSVYNTQEDTKFDFIKSMNNLLL